VLVMPQRFNRIELCGLVRGAVTEENSHCAGKNHSGDDAQCESAGLNRLPVGAEPSNPTCNLLRRKCWIARTSRPAKSLTVRRLLFGRRIAANTWALASKRSGGRTLIREDSHEEQNDVLRLGVVCS
jgi:hypothetical protein